ncbi:unnamed protein product, partial [Chrysoparadoxa australica]
LIRTGWARACSSTGSTKPITEVWNQGSTPYPHPIYLSHFSSSFQAPSSLVANSGKHPPHIVVSHPPHPSSVAPIPPPGCQSLFAIIRLQGIQHKVTQTDVIVSEKVRAAEVGDLIDAEVLLLGGNEKTIIGRPSVPDARVQLRVESQTRDKKIHIYKRRRRKNSKRLRGFRKEVTLLRVMEIDAGNNF